MEEKEIKRMVDELSIAVSTNGRNKDPEDFNLLHEYIVRYNKKPSCYNFYNPNTDLYLYSKFKADLLEAFPECKIVYKYMQFSFKYDKEILFREIIELKKGYLLNLQTDIAINHFDDPEDENDLDATDEIIHDNIMLLPAEHDAALIKKLQKVFRQSKIEFDEEKVSIEMISTDHGELCAEEFTLFKEFSDMVYPDLHYGEGFDDFHQQLSAKLKNTSKGLVLLHGEPGTGKSFYIRHLLKDLSTSDIRILYISPTMVSSITDPSFINFISKWANNEDGKKGILLIEDAEPLVESRDSGRNIGITNLLNMTDGLLNDFLHLQIIVTFNIKITALDKALLRPERLIARKEFTRMPLDRVKELIKKIGVSEDKVDAFMKKENVKDMSLAEVYALKQENEIIEHNVKTNKNTGSVGFKS